MTVAHVYQPPAPWWTCGICAVMWTGFEDTACWACGSAGVKSWQPRITSQSGFAPASWLDD